MSKSNRKGKSPRKARLILGKQPSVNGGWRLLVPENDNLIFLDEHSPHPLDMLISVYVDKDYNILEVLDPIKEQYKILEQEIFGRQIYLVPEIVELIQEYYPIPDLYN